MKSANMSKQIDADGVAVITIDVTTNPMNALNLDLVDDFISLCDEVRQDKSVKAIVVTSGKPNVFVAGADITMIEAAKTAKDGETIAGSAQKAFNHIAALPQPIVAAVNGPALGGGYELALACSAIVASDDPATKLGLPEVMLGVLPAGGGTQRLPRRMGLMASLDFLLTGKTVAAKKALRLGMVDEVVPKSILLDTAKRKALQLVDERRNGETKKSSLLSQLSIKSLQSLVLEKNSLGRKLVFKKAEQKLQAKTQGNYPAPEAILDCVQTGIEYGISLGFDRERVLFGRLAVTPEAKELINIFFSGNALKKEHYGAEEDSKTINKIAVLGGGLMGGGISSVSVSKTGSSVRIKDISDDGLRNALKHIHDGLQSRVKRRSLTASQAKQQMAKVTGTLDYSGFKSVDLVIEAVFEDLAVKQQIVADIEANAGEQTIFASNTSSLRIADIAAKAAHPERVIGMHYFSPVEKMPLLEIITHAGTADWVVNSCVNYGRKQGKTVIVVKDGAGFYVNRILGPYINEAAYLLQDGVKITDIDKAMVKWGFPVGPLKLLDEVGLDVAAKIQPNLLAQFGERMTGPDTLEKLLADGRKGKKSAKGFYLYNQKEKGEDESIYTLLNIRHDENARPMDPEHIAERCAYAMLNEAVMCLDDSTIRCARDGDLGAVYGIGFPPFRGGPFRLIDHIGVSNFVDKLNVLSKQYGERFKPAPLLISMAENNRRFYDEED